MKAIQITTLQATIAAVLASVAGILSPMMQRGLMRLMHRQGALGGPPLIPNVETGFELVGVVTAGGFLLAWACFVSANRQPSRGRAAKLTAICIMPVSLGLLGALALARLRFSATNPARGPGPSAALQAVRNSGPASVAAIETFWLSATVLAVLMLLYFSFVPVRPSPGKTP